MIEVIAGVLGVAGVALAVQLARRRIPDPVVAPLEDLMRSLQGEGRTAWREGPRVLWIERGGRFQTWIEVVGPERQWSLTVTGPSRTTVLEMTRTAHGWVPDRGTRAPKSVVARIAAMAPTEVRVQNRRLECRWVGPPLDAGAVFRRVHQARQLATHLRWSFWLETCPPLEAAGRGP